MSQSTEPQLLESIQAARSAVSLAELLAQHPTLKRRTVQRWLGQWVDAGVLTSQGKGSSHRYRAGGAGSVDVDAGSMYFAGNIPVSADSQDILAYISQPPSARKPVGYQREFLDA